jgi:hypothetical protein
MPQRCAPKASGTKLAGTGNPAEHLAPPRVDVAPARQRPSIIWASGIQVDQYQLGARVRASMG